MFEVIAGVVRRAPVVVKVAVVGVVAVAVSAAAVTCLGVGLLEAQLPPSTLLPPVVITETRVDSARTRSLSATTVLMGSDLRRRSVLSVADALRLVPGVSVVQSGSAGSETALFIRGGERDFVLVLIDGVPANEPGGFINLAHLSTDNVERIEVVRGPLSTLYGTHAVTGVVQIFTREAGESGTAELSVRTGSRSLRSGEFTIADRGPRASYSIGAARYRVDGIYNLNNHNANDSYSLRSSLLLGDARVNVSGRMTNGRYNYPTSFYGAPLDSNSFSQEMRVVAGADVFLPVGGELSAILGFTHTLQKVLLSDEADAFTAFPFESRTRTTRDAVEGRINYTGLPNSTLTLGLAQEWEDSESPSDSEDLIPLLSRWNRSLFAQLLSSPAPRMDFTAGVRVDENQRFGTFATWRAAAGFQAAASTRVRAGLGTAFRAPQFSEITGAGFAKPNVQLAPEHTRSWEMSVEQSLWNDRIFASATFYEQEFRDLVVYASLENDPAWFNQYQNEDEARASGWEFELRSALRSNLSAQLSHSISDTRVRGASEKAGSSLLRRPLRTSTARLGWTPAEVISLDFAALYTGPRFDTRFFEDFSSSREFLGGYTTVDLSGQWTIQSGLVSSAPAVLTLRIENVLDRAYEEVAGFQAPGRRVLVGAKVLLHR